MAEFSGHLLLRAEARAGAETVLARQSFRAPFHLSKPYWTGDVLLVQVVNPTAGVLENDRFDLEVSVGNRAALLLTNPSATRIFQMGHGRAESSQRFAVEDGGWLDYFPEPLVPHTGSRFCQRTEIDVANGGEVFFAELLMPGRMARGEVWSWDQLCLQQILRVAGNMVIKERLEQSGAELKALAELADMGGGACFANVLVVSPKLAEADAWCDEIRGLHVDGAWVGLSALRGGCGAWSIKTIAPEGVVLRQVLQRVRQILSCMLPRLRAELRRY